MFDYKKLLKNIFKFRKEKILPLSIPDDFYYIKHLILIVSINDFKENFISERSLKFFFSFKYLNSLKFDICVIKEKTGLNHNEINFNWKYGNLSLSDSKNFKKIYQKENTGNSIRLFIDTINFFKNSNLKTIALNDLIISEFTRKLSRKPRTILLSLKNIYDRKRKINIFLRLVSGLIKDGEINFF